MSENADQCKKASDSEQLEIVYRQDEVVIFVPMSITRSKFEELTTKKSNVHVNNGDFMSTTWVSCEPVDLFDGLVYDDFAVVSAIAKSCWMIEGKKVFVIVPKQRQADNM